MERMSCWSLTNSAYVCIAACVLEFESANYWRSMQYDEVVCKFNFMRYFAVQINKYTAMAMVGLRYLTLIG